MADNRDQFESIRRDSLLEQTHYEKLLSYYSKDKSNRYKKILDSNNSMALRKRVSWSLALHKFEQCILEYSAGKDIKHCSALMKDALDEFNRHKSTFPQVNYLYWEPDSFRFILWAMSFAALSGNLNDMRNIVRSISKNPQDEDDPLLSILLARLGYIGFPRLDYLAFPKSYQHLYESVKGDGVTPSKEERQESLKQYLKGWYNGSKDCYWYNLHKLGSTHFGYWAFEAVLVTVLYELDDSSYRHLPFYPKDLVEHSRQTGIAEALKPDNIPQHHIAFPNDESPVSSEWVCNLSSESTFVNQGEKLPTQDDDENKIFWVSV
ncbi:PoNe immunity protein domain-containing protein [Vibrio penaeicida]|uniref:PoNe immunity protein domain-containing protein n=1 Tax=Vibrio penaeicida TaxID=104609 RepID=UPI000CEA35EE|nr:PoNe immunity protein domain-containing protein [Vibrio penaeicida]